MSFSRKNALNYLLFDTAVDNLYISEYMSGAPGDYVKTYLSALMRVSYGLPTDDETIAKALSLPITTVEKSWKYWEEQGVIRRKYLDAGRTRFEREFVNIREEVFGGMSRKSESPESVPRAVSLGDEQLAQLYRDIEAVTGRMLDSREPEIIASWIAEYDMQPQLIVMGYKYCKERGKSDRWRYVGTVLKDWRAKSLSTPADVEDYLSGVDKHYSMYRRIFKELGFNRNPSEPEKRIMDSWFEEMSLPMEEILKACAKTTGIANPNLNYVNAILISDYERARGITKAKGIGLSVDDIYLRIRKENEKKSAELREKIFAELPEAERLTEEIRETGLKMSKLILSGAGRKAGDSLRKKVAELSKERSDLLEKAGYGSDALDMKYTCKDCRDTGLLEDGTRCHCYAEKLEKLSAG